MLLLAAEPANPPSALGTLCLLLQVLEAQGAKALAPTSRAGLHPLVIPLCSSGSDPATGKELVTCLLRWPEPTKCKV